MSMITTIPPETAAMIMYKKLFAKPREKMNNYYISATFLKFTYSF